MPAHLSLHALEGIPEIEPGCDLARVLADALERSVLVPRDGDVVAVAQKIVSKAEGRIARLSDFTPSERAQQLAAEADKDPRLVEAILSESTDVVRVRRGVLVVEHRSGIVLANAGIDQSNVPRGAAEHSDSADSDDATILLLPLDSDASARELKERLDRRFGARLAVLINDSLGRAWRIGTSGIAIGCAGLAPVLDLRGEPDREGRELRVSVVGHADEIAAAASIVMGQGNEGIPAVLVRGLPTSPADEAQGARALVRPIEEDLFR